MGENPKPIPGGWCPVTCPAPGTFGPTAIYPACECPAPAFGGAPCPAAGSPVACAGVIACGPCPNGQQCMPPDGHCGCQGGLTCNGQCKPGCAAGDPSCCSPLGSIPSADCTKCICPKYSTIIGNTCVAPTPVQPTCNPQGQNCTCSNGLVCPAGTNLIPNSNCTSCVCPQYTFWNGNMCAYCTQPCTTSYDGLTCVTEICPQNMTCDPKKGNACECDTGSHWDPIAKDCVYSNCPKGKCPLGANGRPNVCGPDTCGNVDGCGICPAPQTCVNGQCACVKGTGCSGGRLRDGCVWECGGVWDVSSTGKM